MCHICYRPDDEPDFMMVARTGGAEGVGNVVLQEELESPKVERNFQSHCLLGRSVYLDLSFLICEMETARPIPRGECIK